MAVLILLAALILLGILAQRYGYDSRDRLRTDDEVRAAASLGWAPDSADRALRRVVLAPVPRDQHDAAGPLAA